MYNIILSKTYKKEQDKEEEKDEDPADSNQQEQIESKDDIFDSIENQKLKEYIDKMEIQFLN